MKKQIGVFEASYNRNTKKLYTSFSPTLSVTKANETECDNCTQELINKTLQESIGEWFNKVSDIEESDIAYHPIKTEVIEQKFFEGTDQIKYQKLSIYQEEE